MIRLFLSLAAALLAATALRADAPPTEIVITKDASKSIRIAGDTQLAALAQAAFKTHGAFRVVPGSAQYTLTFTPAGANQVRVDVSTGNPARSVLAQTVTGTSQRNALFRAADAAVEQITGAKGFFAGKLTFISERSGHREIYTADFLFGETLQITNDRADALTPRWSPQGTKIIYTSFFRSGTPDIFIIDVNTRQRTSFANFKGTNSAARYSPTGSQIAAALSADGNQEIFVGAPGTKNFRRLTRSSGVETSPVWSPDGARLLFTSDRDGRAQLFTMPANGGGMTRVPTGISGYCAEPDWSTANPNKIAFTAAQGGGHQIAVYDFSTRSSTWVSKGPSDSVEPCWLADGRHLIYTARSANVRRIIVLDTQTGRSTPISPNSLGSVSQVHYWKK